MEAQLAANAEELGRLKKIVATIYKQLKIALPVTVGRNDTTGRLRSRLVLHREIELRFSLEELDGFIADLGIDADNIPGVTKEERVRGLILWFLRRQRPLAELVEALRAARPGVAWPEMG